MHARQLNMLHNGRDKGVGSVADGVCLTLGGMMQETVDKDRAVRGHAYGCPHIFCHAFRIVYYLHAAAAQHIGGAYHDRIADLLGNGQSLVYIHCHACLRHGDLQLLHNSAETIAVLCQIDDLRAGAQDAHAVLLQIRRQVQGRLAAELGDDAHRLLLFVDAQHILQGQRLEIQLVGGVVVCGNRLRIAVYNDGLKAQLFQGDRRVDAAVVELNALSDTVRAAAQDHDLLAVGVDRALIRRVVGGIIVSAVLRSAHMDALPGLRHADGLSGIPDLILRYFQKLCQVAVGEAVLFRLCQRFRRRHASLSFQKLFLLFHQLTHLLDEIGLDFRQLIEFFRGGAFADRLVHDELALAGGHIQHLQQLPFALLMEILGEAQAVAADLQASDGLLEGFLIGLSDAHDLAHGAHLRAQLILHALEFLKGPADRYSQ